MRGSFPSFSRRLFVAIGTGALLVLVVVLVTGGFVIDVGPIRVSARRSTGPLLIAVVAWLAAAWRGRAELARSATEIAPFLERHATAVAVVVAAACAGVGLACGTYSASSADPSGYVSHAALVAAGRLVDAEPLAQALEWPDGTWSFTPLGYRPGRVLGELAPGYPLGLPAMMAGASLWLGEMGPFIVVPLFGAALVLGCFGLGVRLHSRLAGLVAAALMATSPVLLFHIVQPMSDVPAAAWAVLAIVAATGRGRVEALLAGLTFGMAVATRPNMAPLGLVVGACAAGGGGRGRGDCRGVSAAGGDTGADLRAPVRWDRLTLVALGIAPSLAVLAAVQWRLYGSPLATGYGGLDQYFALANVGANARDYAWRVVRGEGAALGLTAAALVTGIAGRAWLGASDASGGGGSLFRRLRPSLALTTAVSVVTLAVYLPYGVFPDWSYLRFLLPALALGFVLVGGVVSEACETIPAWARGLALTLAAALACSVNVVVAHREQAFNLRAYESRYRSVGRYLAASLPASAVVVTSQESGSVRHYTGLPIVRWDLLPIDLEEALEGLRRLGRRPVLVVEDWERSALGSKFPRSPTAALDWTPQADIGETTRVWVLDPADRLRGVSPTTDRFR